jgi:hypothetical protein
MGHDMFPRPSAATSYRKTEASTHGAWYFGHRCSTGRAEGHSCSPVPVAASCAEVDVAGYCEGRWG